MLRVTLVKAIVILVRNAIPHVISVTPVKVLVTPRVSGVIIVRRLNREG